MIHEQYPSHIPEQMANREAASRNFADAAAFQTSVDAAYAIERDFGGVSEETKHQASLAGQRYNDAIRWLLEANCRIREAE